jgi:tripartite-type tricarboxylate transporter receptor subunit TctC
MKTPLRNTAAFLLSCSLLSTAASAAESVADFYKSKTVFLQIGSATGGSYDVTGRLFARHMSRFIPGNPTVVVQNVPAGGSMVLANQFANTTLKDGTYFGLFNNGMPTLPLSDPKSAHFDVRQFIFLGSPNRQAQMLGVWHTAKARTIDDFFTQELVVGATAPGSASYDFPRLANAILGTKFKLVTGYTGVEESKLAMQRGEVDATFTNLSSVRTDFADVIKNKEFILAAAFGMKQHPAVTHVPLMPLGKTAEDRQIFQLMYARQDYGNPFMMPPGVPADRAAAMRQAFEATMKDKDFLREAEKLNVEIDPVSADDLVALTERLYQTPPSVVENMAKILAPPAK